MLKDTIRTIPDYPKPGIQFRDITTLLGNSDAFKAAVDALAAPYRNRGISKVAGIEARGFILGGAVAVQLGAGFVPIRKKGKLPHETVRIGYSLEYGSDEMEIHRDEITMAEKLAQIQALLAENAEVNLRDLFALARTKREMIVTFLTVLEMVKERRLRLLQREIFGDIFARSREEGDVTESITQS